MLRGVEKSTSKPPPRQRQGPDPTNPLIVPDAQSESPINQGTFKSHYLMFMLGATTWF